MTASEIIDAMGGTSKVAKECRIRMQSVSVWRKIGIPPARMMYFRLAHPEVFANAQASVLSDNADSSSNSEAGN
jgi:hypothetical protein